MLGNTAVECLGAGGLVRPIHAQPLASKCRVEPTGFCWGKSNSRSTASCNGWIELEVTLIEDDVMVGIAGKPGHGVV